MANYRSFRIYKEFHKLRKNQPKNIVKNIGTLIKVWKLFNFIAQQGNIILNQSKILTKMGKIKKKINTKW